MADKDKREKVASAEDRLTREEKLQVIKWFVELRSTTEISELVKQEFDKDISRQAVWKYRNSKKWKPIINRLRIRFEKSILKISIANKVDRLRLLQKVVREGLTWSLKQITKDGVKIYELKLGAVTQAIREARVEMEGEGPLIDASTHKYYSVIQQLHGLSKEKEEKDDPADGLKSRDGLRLIK